MIARFSARTSCLALALMLAATPAAAQDRSSDNAVTQAEDAFGFSIGRESLGIYGPNNTRGFSPSAAGNLRIDGLYFDPVFGLNGLVTDQVSIKVGPSAQGYPFAAPSGIVDIALVHPGFAPGASLVLSGDSFGSYDAQLTGSMPIVKDSLTLGYGASFGHVAYPDGTGNANHAQALTLRWKPTRTVEIIPFWTVDHDFNDESGPFYVPAGDFLPPTPPAHQFDGPWWADNIFAATNKGLLASWTPSKTWQFRLGAFHSAFHSKASYANLMLDMQPDGSADRLIIADPPLDSSSNSGEARLSHSIVDGPRLHIVHLSFRSRDRRNEYGGEDFADLGPNRIGEPEDSPMPDFSFGPTTHQRVQQRTAGLSYVGLWKNVGELGFSISRANYRKTVTLPELAPQVTRSNPILWNATAAATLSKSLSLYAGYARGLEDSGTAPPNAANRNEPLPAILTSQREAGVRWKPAAKMTLIAGVFDLQKPTFGFDTSNVFHQVGTIQSRGAEVSLSGSLTRTLDIVAGGVFLKPRVTRDPDATGNVGKRPPGLPSHLLNLNLNWKSPWKGLSFDAAGLMRARVPSTTDNEVYIPPRNILSLGGRYRFKIAHSNATLRIQTFNIFNDRSVGYGGPGIYTGVPSRYVNGYLAIDL
jgi:iron complex outermembrane receptor protein